MQKADRTRTALLLLLAVMALRLPAGWLLTRLFPGISDDPAAYYAALMVQEGLLWGLPALLLRPWRSGRLPRRKRCLGLGAAMLPLGLAAQAAMMAVTAAWSETTGAAQAAVLLPQNTVEWVLAALALAVMPALAEEAFFRGGLLTALTDRLGIWPALGFTTVIFALMHGSLAGLPAHLGISLLCGLTMLASGRLWLGMTLHAAYNGAALLLRDVPLTMVPALPAGMICLAAAVTLLSRVQPARGRAGLTLPEWLLAAAVLLAAAAVYLPEMI